MCDFFSKNMQELFQYDLIGPKVVKIRHSALNSENIPNLAIILPIYPLAIKLYKTMKKS